MALLLHFPGLRGDSEHWEEMEMPAMNSPSVGCNQKRESKISNWKTRLQTWGGSGCGQLRRWCRQRASTARHSLSSCLGTRGERRENKVITKTIPWKENLYAVISWKLYMEIRHRKPSISDAVMGCCTRMLQGCTVSCAGCSLYCLAPWALRSHRLVVLKGKKKKPEWPVYL